MTMAENPIELGDALATFDALWSPHIVTRVNDYDVRVATLPRGSVFTVPRGVEHCPHARRPTSILLFEPTGTSSVGDRHDEVPENVDATTGHALKLD